MQIQWLRGPHGERKGIVLSWKPALFLPVTSSTPEYERVCDYCGGDAVMFCKTHALYLCAEDLEEHAAHFKRCSYLSISVARAWHSEVSPR